MLLMFHLICHKKVHRFVPFIQLSLLLFRRLFIQYLNDVQLILLLRNFLHYFVHYRQTRFLSGISIIVYYAFTVIYLEVIFDYLNSTYFLKF